MRLRHPDGTTVHLAYCTNVHPAEDLAGIVAQLDTYAVAVRRALECDVLGVGLWLAAPVAAGLAVDPGRRRWLRHQLDARGLEVVTLNGFPYQAFQAPVVKHGVYHPDWTTTHRVAYTLDLARILDDLLPDTAARGSISTLPLAWREPWTPERESAARRTLDDLVTEMRVYHGRIRIAFEPEPGCVIENTDQAIAGLSTLDPHVAGVCVDLAHLACGWEEPADALRRYAAAGVPVVKVQVSAALQVDRPTPEVLADYVEPRFLHQVRNRDGGYADDLPAAFDAGLPGPWRIHYHIPLHAKPTPPLRSTVDVMNRGLAALMDGPTPVCDHLEVETYTWNVLPPAQRPDTPEGLARGIAAELWYARDKLVGLGLKEAVS